MQFNSVSNNVWKVIDCDERLVQTIKQKYDVSEIVGKMLSRKISDHEEMDSLEFFLNPKVKDSFINPFILLDMDKAIFRLIEAIINNEKIVIYGDYDVDGATSSALFKLYLRNFNIEAEIYIPDRIKEGYGPNANAFEKLKNQGFTLCITVDCGTIANEPINYAQSIGLDIIVVDHHMSTDVIPEAVAVVNPNRIDQIETEYKYLAAVGVSFIILIALNSKLFEINEIVNKFKKPNILQYLDIVALGTICDVMKLVGINRAFVKQGLKVFAKSLNCGLRILINILNINESINVYHLGYIIGPHINSGGRIGDSSLGAKLLSCVDKAQATEYAMELVILNNERKKIEQEFFCRALSKVENTEEKGVLILKDGVHQGIIGILAGRLKDYFYLPAIVISLNKDGIGKASARSISGINIGALILNAKAQGIVLEGGGHSMAAGFSIKAEKISQLTQFLNENCDLTNVQKVIEVFDILTVNSLSLDLWHSFQKVSPFGMGNPEPKFVIKDFVLTNVNVVGVNHVSFFITDPHNIKYIKAIAFRSVDTPIGDYLLNKKAKYLLGKLKTNYYNGRLSLEFLVEDVAI